LATVNSRARQRNKMNHQRDDDDGEDGAGNRPVDEVPHGVDARQAGAEFLLRDAA